MKIEKLRLKGMIGVKRGLGLDEIEVDFTGHDGLIALAGQNGTGKSTLIESLSPFNCLASRSGALYNHTFLRDSERELSFVYNGDHYRTLLKIDCQSGKSEGFLWKNGNSEINGKISAYAKYVKELFGSPELFYNSVFCSQNSTKLSDMTTGELKTLFAEFLRLGRLQEFEATTKECINVLAGKASQIETSLEALRKRTEGAQGTQEAIDRLNVSLAEQIANKTTLGEKLTAAQKEREGMKETIARNEVLTAQVETMTNNLFAMRKNMIDEGATAETKLSGLRADYKTIASEIADADAILASEAAIFAAVQNEKDCKEMIESLTEAIEQIANAIAGEQAVVTAYEKEIQELNHRLPVPSKDERITAIKGEISTIVQRIDGYKGQLKTLDVRDQECTSKSCSFTVAALKAKDELPAAQDRLMQLQIEKENRLAELNAIGIELLQQITAKEELLKASRARLTEQQDIQSAKRKVLATKRLELNQYKNMAEKQAALAVAKSQKADREKALEENKKQGVTTSAEWTARKTVLDDQIQKQSEKINEITACISEKAVYDLNNIENNVLFFGREIRISEEGIVENEKQIAALQSELSGMAEAEAQLRKSNEDKLRVNADIADWTYLRNACGKNGLQALEIDATAPLISSFANNLLSKAFGPLFSVKLLTQNDEGKEVLDIVVISDDGEEILLDNLSGGQKIWILMALRLAMTLLSKEKSGKNFESFFADEIDGPLDSENANNFIKMYQAFMAIGGFKSGYFISHKESCRDLADSILMFEPNKNPYFQ